MVCCVSIFYFLFSSLFSFLPFFLFLLEWVNGRYSWDTFVEVMLGKGGVRVHDDHRVKGLTSNWTRQCSIRSRGGS